MAESMASRPRTVRFGVFELDLRAGELRKGGTRIRLQEQPFQVLAALTERPGDLVSRDELRSRLWPPDVVVDFDHSLNKAVNKLRELLGDSADNPRFIETLPKRGYRFIAPVSVPPPDASAAAPAAVSAAAHANVALSAPAPAPPRPADPGLESPQPPVVAESGVAPPPTAFPFSGRAGLALAGLVGLAVLVATAALWWPRPEPSAQVPATVATGTRRVKLAVLPFKNLAGRPDEDFFSDGLTEEMIAQLGRIRPERLAVIARTSAMHYRNTTKLVAEIGQELGVDYILEGSVRRVGDRVRITAQLVQIRDQTTLWAENYDRDLADVFAIQREVSGRIGDSLALELLPPQQGRQGRPPTTSARAHEAYLRGRYAWSKRTEESLRESLQHFEQAVREDPGYALGFVGISDSHNLLVDYGALPPTEAFPQARAAALRALEIDPDLAEAHASLAWTTLVYGRDVRAALAGFERAIALNPGYASAHQWQAFALKVAGRHDEAMEAVRHAQELDPMSLIINAIAAWHAYYARDYDQAIARARRVIAIDPTFSRVYSYLGWSLLQKGQSDEALAALETASRLSGHSPSRELERAQALAIAGHAADARRIVANALQQAGTRYVESDLIARVYVALGEHDRAFLWLDRALAEHAPKLVMLRLEPRLDPIRADPRFADLLRRAGL